MTVELRGRARKNRIILEAGRVRVGFSVEQLTRR